MFITKSTLIRIMSQSGVLIMKSDVDRLEGQVINGFLYISQMIV